MFGKANSPEMAKKVQFNTNKPAGEPVEGAWAQGPKGIQTINANINVGNTGFPQVSPYYLIQSMYYPPKSQCVMGPNTDVIELGPPVTYQFNFFNAVNDGNNYVLKVNIGTINNGYDKVAASSQTTAGAGGIAYGNSVSFTKAIRGATIIKSLEIVKVTGTTYTTVLTSVKPRLSGFQLDNSINNALIVLAADANGGLFTPVLGFGKPSTTTSSWIGFNLQWPNTNADLVPAAVTFKIEPGTSAPALTIKTAGVWNDQVTYGGASTTGKDTGSSVYSFITYQHGSATNLKGALVTMSSTIASQTPAVSVTLPDTCAVAGCVSYTLFLPDGSQQHWPKMTAAGGALAQGESASMVEGVEVGAGSFAPVNAPTRNPVTVYQSNDKIEWVYGDDGEDCVTACARYDSRDCAPDVHWPTTQEEFNFFCTDPHAEGVTTPPPAKNKACVVAPADSRKRALDATQTDDFTPAASLGDKFVEGNGAPAANPFGDYAQKFFPAFSYANGYTDDCADGTIFVGTGVGTCKAKKEHFNRYCPCMVDQTKKKTPLRKPSVRPTAKPRNPTARPAKHNLRKAA